MEDKGEKLKCNSCGGDKLNVYMEHGAVAIDQITFIECVDCGSEIE